MQKVEGSSPFIRFKCSSQSPHLADGCGGEAAFRQLPGTAGGGDGERLTWSYRTVRDQVPRRSVHRTVRPVDSDS